MGSALAGMGVMTGVGIALGGLSLLLAPTPKLNTGGGDTNDSFLFGNNVNPSGQNFAIPIGCGRFRVPGLPIASRIETNQILIGANQTLPDQDQ
jgi:predicted phage tail protein